jgi:hypothetical protein
MSLKIEYFLKNYLLNFKTQREKGSAYLLQETDGKYGFKLNVGNRDFTLNIEKTRRLDVPERYVLMNLDKGETCNLLCFYEVRGIGTGSTLFKSSKGLSIVAYSEGVGGNVEVNVGVNLIDEVFYHLSGLEEYEKECNGKKIRSYYWGDIDKTANEPLVDDFYNLFAEIINTVLEKLNSPENIQRKLESFNVSLTHDVDAIQKDYYTSIRYLAFLLFTLIKKCDFNAVSKMRRYFNHSSNFNRITDVMHTEEGFGYRSTFFLYSNVSKGGFLPRVIDRFIDPAYDITNGSVLTSVRDVFDGAGFEVGLHSSYMAARSYELLEEEFSLLQRLLSQTVISNRNHFLNFSLIHTPLMLEKVGIKCDTTFYYNNVCGFIRHKTCSPFYFYSHLSNRIVDVIEIPTVVMDSTLFNHLGCTEEEAYKESIKVLDKVRGRNGLVCINWHSETSAPEYGWHSTYKDVLKWIKDNGAHSYTIKEVYHRLKGDEAYNGTVVNTG